MLLQYFMKLKLEISANIQLIWKKMQAYCIPIASNCVSRPQNFIFSVLKNGVSFPILIADKIFHVTVLLAAITVTCSYRRIFAKFRSSCRPWCATCQARCLVERLIFQRDFLSSQHPHSFVRIYGRRIASSLIRSITRCGDIQQRVHRLLHSCTALTNWRSVCWTFGTAWTRASLTMQLTGGVRVFERVWEQKADISTKCCKLDNSIVCRTTRQDIISFHHTWRL